LRCLRNSCVTLSDIAQYPPLLLSNEIPPVFKWRCGCSIYQSSYGS